MRRKRSGGCAFRHSCGARGALAAPGVNWRAHAARRRIAQYRRKRGAGVTSAQRLLARHRVWLHHKRKRRKQHENGAEKRHIGKRAARQLLNRGGGKHGAARKQSENAARQTAASISGSGAQQHRQRAAWRRNNNACLRITSGAVSRDVTPESANNQRGSLNMAPPWRRRHISIGNGAAWLVWRQPAAWLRNEISAAIGKNKAMMAALAGWRGAATNKQQRRKQQKRHIKPGSESG